MILACVFVLFTLELILLVDLPPAGGQASWHLVLLREADVDDLTMTRPVDHGAVEGPHAFICTLLQLLVSIITTVNSVALEGAVHPPLIHL